MCWGRSDPLLLWPGRVREVLVLHTIACRPCWGFVLSAHGWMLPRGAVFLALLLLRLFVRVNRERARMELKAFPNQCFLLVKGRWWSPLGSGEQLRSLRTGGSSRGCEAGGKAGQAHCASALELEERHAGGWDPFSFLLLEHHGVIVHLANISAALF